MIWKISILTDGNVKKRGCCVKAKKRKD